MTSAALIQLVVCGRSSGPHECGSGGVVAPPRPLAGAGMPQVLRASMNPGYTVRPSPSIARASGGGVIFSPTDSISPARITTVPLLIAAPLTVTIFALRITTAVGSGCAAAKAPARISATSKFLIIKNAYLVIQKTAGHAAYAAGARRRGECSRGDSVVCPSTILNCECWTPAYICRTTRRYAAAARRDAPACRALVRILQGAHGRSG